MKRPSLVAAIAVALVFAAVASAAKTPTWKTMTLKQRLGVVKHEIRTHRPPVRWWIRHHARLPQSASSSATPTVYCKSIGIRAPGAVCIHAQKLVKALNVRERIRANIAAAAAAARARALAASFPPHHALWDCIGRFEGGPTSVNPNGHFGKLQMTYNWFNLIRGRASDYPESVQEWAAEHAYMAQGSRSARIAFLYGQWFNYDGAAGTCLGLA